MTVELTPTVYTMYDQGNGTWKTTEPSGGSNLPPGFTQLESREFGTANETGWWSAGATYYDIVADASPEAQSRTGNVGRIRYPAGYAGGSAPTSSGIDLANSAIWVSGSDEIFLEFRYKVSANWQAHATGTNKIFFVTMSGQGGGGNPSFVSMQTQLTPWQTLIRHQGTGGVSVPDETVLSVVGVDPDEWHTCEYWAKRNTTDVATDGAFRMWVDGTLVQEDLACSWYNTAGAKWDTIKWEPTWGGGGGTVTNEMYMYMSYIDVYVKGGV